MNWLVAGLIPCAILLLGLFLIPESPRWLAKMGREKQFETALKTLRGKDTDISHEAAEIKDYIETLERLPKAKLLDLFQRRYLRSVIIGVGLMFFQQFGGINGVCFYVSNIFESAGKEVDLCCRPFILYAAINALGIFFVAKVVPETKGRTLICTEISCELSIC